MKQIAIRLGLTASLAASITVAGCKSQQKCCNECAVAAVIPVAKPAVVEPEPTPAETEKAKPEPRKFLPIDYKAERVDWTGGRKDNGRRTFRDITAHPAFSHADDYSWMIGELQYVTLDKAWVVRYASAEEEDLYGGSVTLLEPRPLSGFKSGMLVRVEGQLVDEEAKGSRPPYRLHAIEPHRPSTAKR